VWTDPRDEDALRFVLAPIDDTELIILEIFPVQYRVRIVSGLPSGCAKFESWDLQSDLEAGTFRIQVLNSVPADPEIACTAIYGMIENTVPLPERIVPGLTYKVQVNDVAFSFDAQ
jgi:inhibitor of cysteine peptidase